MKHCVLLNLFLVKMLQRNFDRVEYLQPETVRVFKPAAMANKKTASSALKLNVVQFANNLER